MRDIRTSTYISYIMDNLNKEYISGQYREGAIYQSTAEIQLHLTDLLRCN